MSNGTSTLRGKLVLVTGATSGIGLVASERLAQQGARLVLVGRDQAKGEMALRRVGAEAVHYADLSNLTEVRRLGTELLDAYPRIDVLVNNAGALFTKFERTVDGIERTFALNHLAYFLLTRLLLERLKASGSSRIVIVASEAHRGVGLDFDDLQNARDYDGWTAYRRSKLCNILFARELARRLAGTGVTVNSLHPGFVDTEFGNNNRGLFRWGLAIAKRFAAISPDKGAQTTVHLASSPEVAEVTGLYFDKCRPRTPNDAAQDNAAAKRLWEESARLTGISSA